MGSIKQQGISSGVFMYIGIALGFVNTVLLFPKVLGPEVFGFTQWLAQTASLFLILAGFGSLNTIIRFFPYFKSPGERHRGYLGFLFVLRTAGVVLTVLLLFLLRDGILNLFSRPDSQELVDRYYWLLSVFLVFLCYFEMLEGYTTALMQPRVSTLFRDIVNRLTTTALIGAFYFGWINVPQFILLFTFRLVLSLLGLTLYLATIGELKTHLALGTFRQPIFGKIASYSFYSLFASIGTRIITKLDLFMISFWLGFTANGIYAVFYFASNAIVIPHQGIASITGPLMADKWKREEYGELAELYRRTALSNFAAGILLFIGIYINLDHLITILGPEFAEGRNVAIFLGIAQLVHIVNGYNGMLITYSPKYRSDLVIKLATALLTVVSNYFLIQWYGITGAAMATALTLALINLFIQLYIWRHFRMHPFSGGMIPLVLIGLATLGLNWLIPELPVHFLLDLLVRSAAVTVFYGTLLLLFRPVPDLNDFFWQLVRRLTPKP